MKKILFAFLSILLSFSVVAHDIEQVNADGVTIWYKITSPNTVSVTYEGTSIAAFVGEYFGNVVIPSSIQYEGVTYDVCIIAQT